MNAIEAGIFLHKINYSESSLIVTCYTEKLGIQKFLFKGGKKKASFLFAMSLVELKYFGRPDSDLKTLVSAEMVERLHFSFDPVKSTIAFFMAELVRKCLDEAESDPACYAFLKGKIKALDSSEDLALFPLVFLTEFTTFLGIQPLIHEDKNVVFDLREGEMGTVVLAHTDCESGPHIDLLVEVFQREIPAQHSRTLRNKALDVMLKYYAIHIPKLRENDALRIAKEVLE